jgi:hypothetical protein
MELLVSVCPSFAEKWEEYKASVPWGRELVYLDISAFASHVGDLVESRSLHELPAVFTVVERFITEGEPYVREAAVVGVLEDLRDVDEEHLLPYFGSETAKWWREMKEFFAGRRRYIGEGLSQ